VWVGTTKNLQCWSVETKKKEFSTKFKSGVCSLLFVEQSNELWVGLENGMIAVVSSMGEMKRFLPHNHDRKVNCMKLCGDNVWSGSSDGSFCVWSTMNYLCLKKIEINAPVLSFDIEKNSVWCISHTGKLNVWDGTSLSLVFEVSRRVQNGILSVNLLPVMDNGKVVGNNVWLTSSDKIVSIWKILARKAYKEITQT